MTQQQPIPDPAMFTDDAFEPLHGELRVQKLTRPSLSYWQDAWIRLKANKRAILSLYIVIGMLLFTILGPQVWRVNPAEQDLLQVSSAPGADRSAVLVAPYRPWTNIPPAPIKPGLKLVGQATTQKVQLIWAPIPGAADYRVYRDIIAPDRQAGIYGLPLGTTGSASDTYYEDLLDLRAGTTYYSVVAMNAEGKDTAKSETLKIKLIDGITASEAVDRGLLKPDAIPPLGTILQLPLHPAGTDYLGRDMLARLMQGAQVSLFIGIVAPLLYVLFGIGYGSIAGFLGGRVDQVMMRFADFVVALPFLLFMILFKIGFGIGPGESGITPLIISMTILLWPGTARLVRGQILQVREEAYVNAAQLLGARTGYLVWRHMIPNTMGVILVTLTFAIPTAIFTEAFLSFIGMGVAPPTASWGSMSNDGIKSMLVHPHELFFPALMISITVLAFNLLGDGLRDALDAKMRSRE